MATNYSKKYKKRTQRLGDKKKQKIKAFSVCACLKCGAMISVYPR